MPPGTEGRGTSFNAAVASRFDEVALLLDEQGANPFRVAAYRRAAGVLRRLDRSVRDVLESDGIEGLAQIRGIGESLARSIRALATTGRLPMLDRLRGQSDPIALLMSVPGVGRTLAERLHDDLGIDSLEELEMAAFDGRLRAIVGIGEKKLAGIRDVLATRLGRARAHDRPTGAAPSVAELLEVDREYRWKARTQQLPTIAPRRFNPSGRAWLPVLHTSKGARHYTALFSNTPKAHRLGRTHDWVVLYADGGRGERQYTVVTEWHGSLQGLRVVRGREQECQEYYAAVPRDDTAIPPSVPDGHDR